MARNINVSEDELANFAEYLSDFTKSINYNCTELKMAYNKLYDTLDCETRDAFDAYVKSVYVVLDENKEKLAVLEAKVRDYLAFVHRLRKATTDNNLTPKTNTLKEKIVGAMAGVVMHEHIKAVDSQYQTFGGYMIENVTKAVNVAESVTGIQIMPPVLGTDKESLDAQIDVATQFIDGHMSLDSANRINRDPSPIPKEQIEEHTLVINNIEKP